MESSDIVASLTRECRGSIPGHTGLDEQEDITHSIDQDSRVPVPQGSGRVPSQRRQDGVNDSRVST